MTHSNTHVEYQKSNEKITLLTCFQLTTQAVGRSGVRVEKALTEFGPIIEWYFIYDTKKKGSTRYDQRNFGSFY